MAIDAQPFTLRLRLVAVSNLTAVVDRDGAQIVNPQPVTLREYGLAAA